MLKQIIRYFLEKTAKMPQCWEFCHQSRIKAILAPPPEIKLETPSPSFLKKQMFSQCHT